MKTENYINAQRAEAIKTADEIIAGKVGIIAGSRIMSRLRFEIGISDDDEDFLTFVAIDSESDELPTGQERELWSPEALKEKDKEIQRCEELYRQNAIEACEGIIRKWRGDV